MDVSQTDLQLLIDAGNTRIKWAIVECNAPKNPANLGQWQQFGTMSHAELSQAHMPWQGIALKKVLISNVAGTPLQSQLQEHLARHFDIDSNAISWFKASEFCAGVKNNYREPTKLGSDRFASLIAANALFADRPLIVATCGTATTIDALTAEGEFVGGMIAPGLGLMAQSLAQRTAQLPSTLAELAQSATLLAQTSFLANHTEAAIISGCISAQVGAIEQAVRQFEKTVNSPNTPSKTAPLCILSGGAAHSIARHLSVPYQMI